MHIRNLTGGFKLRKDNNLLFSSCSLSLESITVGRSIEVVYDNNFILHLLCARQSTSFFMCAISIQPTTLFGRLF